MRIRNMELMYSAAGIKPGDIHIFTDFNFLKPTHIFNLMSKWLKVDIAKNLSIYEEISNILQGRPRFFMSFLHSLIDSSDVENCFRRYVRDMTTKYDSSLSSAAPYFFWKDRIHWTIEPISITDSGAFEVKFVSETLIKLCHVFLFGDGSSVAYSPNFDLVSTGLVMISKDSREWWAIMAEPIVITAGLNYMADVDGQLLMKYFASQLFSAVGMLTLTPSERGHMMELVVALRFIQGWWLEPALKSYLPEWAKATEILKPVGILDCRSKDSSTNMLLQQLRSRKFPYVVLPPVNAGPDLRYSVFCCCIKTTWTSNSQTTCYVTVDERKKNIATLNPANWYQSQSSVQCSEEIGDQRFAHLRFELPDTAPSLKGEFKTGTKGNDYMICVNLDSDFAEHFFGQYFVGEYKKFISSILPKSK